MLQTILCDILEIKYPILLGGMAYAGNHILAAAVSNAGGLGVIGSGSLSLDELAEEINNCRKKTDNPFGVNCFLKDVDCLEKAKVSMDMGVKALFTGIGNPKAVIDITKGTGIPVIPTVATVRHAHGSFKAGAKIIVAEGQEGGGHIGSVSTLPLIPQVRDAVGSDIPIVAAGGIGDGSQLVASLTLGAVGVMMGTRFLSAKESPLHEDIKNRLIEASVDDTTVTGRFTGLAMRCLANEFTGKFQTMEKELTPYEMLQFGSGKIRAGLIEGDVCNGSCPAGQVIGMIRKQETVKEIIDDMIQDAQTLIEKIQAPKGFNGWKGY